MCIRRVGAAVVAMSVMITHSFLASGLGLGFVPSSGSMEFCFMHRTVTTSGMKHATRIVKHLSGTDNMRSNRRGGSSIKSREIGDGSGASEYVAGAEEIVERLVRESNNGVGVFYNRVGSISRDLSVLMASVLAEERLRDRYEGDTENVLLISEEKTSDQPVDQMRDANEWRRNEKQDKSGLVVLDAFAASGVRALRYLTEVPGVRRVVANDYDTSAVELMRRAGDLCGAGKEFEARYGDALDVMYAARAGGLGTYDIIDIDPYGESASFLDAGVQAVKDGGLLCITSTDMPVLSGVQPEAAYARYGSVPTRGGYHQEMSLRILLHATSAAAARQRRSIKPVLSVAVDHYVRVFVRIFRSPKAALVVARNKASYVLQSETCPSFFVVPVLARKSARKAKSLARATPFEDSQPSSTLYEEGDSDSGQAVIPPLGGRCPETGGNLRIGGPIWSGPLHDQAWVARAIALASGGGKPISRVTGVKDRQASAANRPRSYGLSSWAEGERTERRGQREKQPRLVARRRVESLLEAVSRELEDVPLFYNLREMFATLGLRFSPRREQVMRALEDAGYRTSGMHKEPLALKTNAPDAAVWDVLRCWVREHPQPPPLRFAGREILARGPQVITDATFVTALTGDGRKRLVNNGGFLHTCNPEEGWGPLPRGSVMEPAAASVSRQGNREDT